jgi:tetratricopeptide (TPR) repeat protein
MNKRGLKVRDLNAHRIYKEVESEAMQSCNYGKLLGKVQEVTKADPMFDKAYVLQGEIFLSLNRFNDAMKVFDKAIAANPKCAKAYASKSLIYDIKNFNEKALEYCNKALECVSSSDLELLVSLFDQKLSILSRMNQEEEISSTLLNAEKLLSEEDFEYLSDFYAQETKLRLVAIS